jgi:hypothetical protein
MPLMSAGQITNYDYHVIIDPNFCYIQDQHTGHMVGTGPIIVTHIVFVSLTDFVFLLLRPSVLSALPLLLHLHRRFLSCIIV